MQVSSGKGAGGARSGRSGLNVALGKWLSAAFCLQVPGAGFYVFLCLLVLVLCPHPCDWELLPHLTLHFCLSKKVPWPILIPAAKYFGFPKCFSDSSHFVVAFLSLYFTNTLFLLPHQMSYVHLRPQMIELLEGVEKLASLSPAETCLCLSIWSQLLALFPVSASFLLRIPCPHYSFGQRKYSKCSVCCYTWPWADL